MSSRRKDVVPDEAGTGKATAARPARRTQAERSEAMRQRLLDATLQCLAEDGYAGTTVSRVIETARVSRGAPVHHFPSKNAMIAAAAEQLIRKVYVQLGQAIARLEASDERLHDLIYACWKELFLRSEHKALNELLLASQRDPELASILRRLWTACYHSLGDGANHYLQARGPDDDVRQLMVLTQWLLRGMALDLPLVESEGLLDHYLRLWSRLLAMHLQARPGVKSPPPRPAFWDSDIIERSGE